MDHFRASATKFVTPRSVFVRRSQHVRDARLGVRLDAGPRPRGTTLGEGPRTGRPLVQYRKTGQRENRMTSEEPWITRDGAPLTIRPIAATDFEIEKAFIAGLSLETGYRRLLSPRKPQDDEIHRFTAIDPTRELAWIAVAETDGRETMCGVARYVRDGAHAEWAIVLADAWQRRGLGDKLLRKLIDSARAAGIEVLSDVTFSTNAGMQALARTLGFTLSREPGDATLTRMTLHL